MKKIISTLLAVIILLNFILCNESYVMAFQGTDSIGEDSITAKDQEMLVNEGKSEDKSGVIGNTIFGWNLLGNIFGTIAGILAVASNVFPLLIQTCMTMLTGTIGIFTIEKAVFNEIGIFNINYFNLKNTYELGTGANKKVISNSSLTKTVRKSIAEFYIIFRIFAIALSLLVLIYVGIRMALSTIASDKVKYKKMLIAWFESIIILFMMQYIISLIFKIGELFGNIMYDIKVILGDDASFEVDIMDTLTSNFMGSSGWNYALNSVIYWFLVFIQTKFFLSYFRRLVTVGFLILISPIVTITYSIDKVGDGKAQAFSVWFSELAVNVFIQPIHALIYLVFMYTAGAIAKYSILVALLFLLSLTKVEKVVLQLFNLKNVTSLKPVEDERKGKGS